MKPSEELTNVVFVDEPLVRGYAEAVLQSLGAPRHERQVVADGLVTASLWWHPGQGQGLEKLFHYAAQVKSGGINPAAEMQWVLERAAVALLDAEQGFGYFAAHRAMARAIQMAKSAGIAIVGVQHSNHFGIAGYHARQAANAGLIGLAMTNSGADMAPWGSAKPVLGTNPWGMAVPRCTPHEPLVLDMALTQSGRGMLHWLQRAGAEIPPDWAIAPDGHRTTDPSIALSGALLPIGDYKGYGLSFMTDILAGVMTGSLFGLSVFQDEKNLDVGHVMMAIDPTVYLSRVQFEERLERLVSEVTEAPPIDDTQPVQLPGQREQERAKDRMANGIPIARNTVDGLKQLADDLDVPFSLLPH